MPTVPVIPQDAVDAIAVLIGTARTDRESIREGLSRVMPSVIRSNDRSQTRAMGFVLPGAAVDAAMAVLDEGGADAAEILAAAAPAILARNTL